MTPHSPFPPAPISTLPSASDANPLDSLQEWIERNPAERGVWEMCKICGFWRVGLSGPDGERFTASQDVTLEGAIRNALMIAQLAGLK